MPTLVDTSVFGLYEIFSNVIPGLIVLVTLWGFVESVWRAQIQIPDPTIFLVFFVFLSYIVGFVIQALSLPFEKLVFAIADVRHQRGRHRRYPSSRLLEPTDTTFPEDFKKSIRRVAHENLKISGDSDSQHIFDLCYTYVLQKNISKRVTTFLNMYSFSRNMSVAMLVEAIVLFIWGALASASLLAFGVVSVGLAYLFCNRFMRYSLSFAEEVFRSYYIDQITRERK